MVKFRMYAYSSGIGCHLLMIRVTSHGDVLLYQKDRLVGR